jgi:hypothetical protein
MRQYGNVFRDVMLLESLVQRNEEAGAGYVRAWDCIGCVDCVWGGLVDDGEEW